MKTCRILACSVAALGLLLGSVSTQAQGTAFTYQGRLDDAGSPASGTYDLRFAIHDLAAGGVQQGSTLTNSATAVSNGLFTVTLDFGSQFPGAARWLEIAARTNGAPTFETLAPRQKFAATPYAITAGNVTGPVAAGQLTGAIAPSQLPPGVVTNGAGGLNLSGNFTGNGSGLTSLNATNLTAGTMADARLSTNVALRNGSNIFTGNQIVASGAVGIGTNNPQSALHVAGTVTASNFVGSVAASQLTGTLSPNNIGAGSITTTMLAAGAVGSNQLAAGAVTTTALADDAVTADKMATVSNWFPLTIINPTPAAGDLFGASVASVGNDRLLIGAFGDDAGAIDAGVAALYGVNGAVLATFTNPTPAVSDQFGFWVAALGDDRVIIAAPYNDTSHADDGAVYLYSTNGTLLTTITNPAPSFDTRFGRTVASLGTDRVLVSAYLAHIGAVNAGAAYLFSTNGALLTTFTNPTPAVGDLFGWYVAAVGTDRVLIGAVGDDAGAIDSGAAYLFNTNGTLLTTFTNPIPGVADWFGNAVAGVGNDRVLISARFADTGLIDSGAAYLFDLGGTLLTTFNNPNPSTSGHFGWSLAVAGSDKVLIGAVGNNVGGTQSGAVYMFNTNGALLTAFTNPTAAAGDMFGISVAFAANGAVLIGARADDTAATDSGTAYLFSVQNYTAGLVAESVPQSSITTESLHDGAVTAGKIGGVLFPSQIPDLDAAKITAGVFNVSRIPNLDAAKITTGTLSDARLSTNVALRSGGNAFTGNQTISGANFLELGAGVVGKELNAGKIGYTTFTTNALDIVGAGTGASDRRIKLWAEGGATIAGNLAVDSAIASTGTQPLDFFVNNQRGLRLAPVGTDTPNVIGGWSNNTVSPGVYGAVIGGGGGNNGFGFYTNSVGGIFGTVGGGLANRAMGHYSTVAGGVDNAASNNGATVAGGVLNTAASIYATVGGGFQSSASGDAATIGGGYQNTVTAPAATVAGGQANQASGTYSMIPGGINNAAAGVTAFAAGNRAKANHTGAFVWADSQAADFASTGNNQFLIRAAGGVGIGTAIPTATLSVNGTANNTTGTWGVFSDARLKENIAPMEGGSLNRLLQLQGVTYDYTKPELREGYDKAHRGWIAQEVEKVFPEWVSETAEGMKMLTPVGFNALAVEALRELRAEQDSAVKKLEAENTELKRELAEIKRLLETLATKGN